MKKQKLRQKLRARSPAKLILSGEHAVVYGHPAIAMAVDRYAESCISSQLLPNIFFNFLNLDYAKSLTMQTLMLLKQRVHEQYHAFLQGQCNIREVLKMPFELLQFAVSNLLEKLNIDLPHGLEIHTSSNIPMGCGMGSSAASVMSMLFALAHFLKLDIDPNRFLTLGRDAENLQHGRSSGLDLQLALHGGCIKFKEGAAEKKSPLKTQLTIIQTGTPLTTTGQCVAQAAKHFQNSSIGNDFAFVTESLELALETQNLLEVKRCIRENHRLLKHINVVPEKVASFIEAVENKGYAAKICGAGAVKGEQAGILWIVGDQNENEQDIGDQDVDQNIDQNVEDHDKDVQHLQGMQDLLKSYGYQMQTVRGDNHGTRVI